MRRKNRSLISLDTLSHCSSSRSYFNFTVTLAKLLPKFICNSQHSFLKSREPYFTMRKGLRVAYTPPSRTTSVWIYFLSSSFLPNSRDKFHWKFLSFGLLYEKGDKWFSNMNVSGNEAHLGKVPSWERVFGTSGPGGRRKGGVSQHQGQAWRPDGFGRKVETFFSITWTSLETKWSFYNTVV